MSCGRTSASSGIIVQEEDSTLYLTSPQCGNGS